MFLLFHDDSRSILFFIHIYICVQAKGLGLLLVHGLNGWCLGSRDGVEDLAGDKVGVGVGGGTTVLEVSLALGLGVTTNTDGGTTVGNAVAEGVDVGGLVGAGEAELVALTVDGNVLGVLGAELVDGLLDLLEAALLAHLLGGDVGVHAGAVPLSLGDGLGVEGAVDLEVLADALEDVAGHHELIASIDADAGSDLVLLLSGHDLAVGAGNVDAGIKAGTVQRLGNVTAEVVLGTDGAVVGTLGTGGHTALGPAEGGLLVEVEEGELLLEAEPGLLVFLAGELGLGDGAGVGGEGLAGGSVGVAHDEDVVDAVGAGAEGVAEDADGAEDDLGIVAGGLVGRGTVEVPLGKVLNGLGPVGGEGARLGAGVADGIDPNVLSEDCSIFGEKRMNVRERLIFGNDINTYGKRVWEPKRKSNATRHVNGCHA